MTGPMRCREAVRQLWEYLDHGLDEPEERALDEHLAFCLRCCGELEFARELRQLLMTRTAAPPPADVVQRLERFVDDLPHDDFGADGVPEDPTGVGPHEP